MLKKHTPVWVWDSYWWSASVVVPQLDTASDVIVVQFENDVTAPVKASDVHLRVPHVEERVLKAQISYSLPERSNLPAGSLASPAIYVVAGFDPVHATPREIVIGAEIILPRCKFCSDVRFSRKCLPLQKIEENAFFNSHPIDLAARLRSAAAQVDRITQASLQLIRRSKQFLATWDPANRAFALNMGYISNG